MATVDAQQTAAAPVQRKAGYPAAGARFDLLATALAVWVIIGIFVDVNAHNHGQVDNTFFTPWHFLLYSGVAANGLLYAIAQLRNVNKGYAWVHSLPKGYLLSLVGVVIFGIAGGFDFVWHSLFGFEADLEALLSPAHLLLAVCAVSFMVGPLRALWGRDEPQTGWRALYPAIVSALITMALLTMYTEFSNVMTCPEMFAGTRGPLSNSDAWNTTLISSLLIPTVIIMGTMLLLLHRWVLPFCAMQFMLSIHAAMMFWMRIGFIGDHWPVLLGAIVTGLAGVGILLWLKPSKRNVGALRFFAFSVPLVYFLLFFTILLSTSGVWWTVHMWLGVTFMAGITGFGLSYLVAPPAVPGEQAG
jgi:hypothetical protein